MGIDYYGVLKVRKLASEDEVKRAYRKLAMKWHPDTHSEDRKEIASDRFKNITIAYEVLSNAEKRRVYDEMGEAAASDELRKSGSRDANEVFKEVFGFGSPLDIDSDKRAGFEGALEKVFSSALELGSVPEITSKAPPIERKLLCTLEELYNGSTRKVKITKNHTDAYGRTVPVEETLTIEVQPGWMAGTKVIFPGKGNSKVGMLPSDVVLVIEEKPHEVLKREGHDLIIVMKVPLVDALTGYTAPVETLDGRLLMVPCVDVLKPSSEVVVKHEGMPIYSSTEATPSTPTAAASTATTITTIASCTDHKNGKKHTGIKLKGDLRLHFHIVFPNQLSASQKAAIRHALVELK